MKRKIFIYVILLVSALLFPQIELEKSKLIVGCVEDFYPYEYIDTKGNPQGYNVELIKAIAKEFGILVEFKFSSRLKIRNLLFSGNIDLTGMPFSEKNKDIIEFSQSIVTISHSVVTRNDAPIYEKISELDGKSVMIVDSSYAVAYLKQYSKARIIPKKSINQILKDLSAGEADCALMPVMVATGTINNLNLENLIINNSVIFDTDYCFSVLKENKSLIDYLNEGLSSIKASGEYGKIYNKWFGAYEEPEFNYKKLVKYLAVILIPIILILILIISWNRTLKQKVIERTKELSASQKIIDEFFEHSPIHVYFKDKNLRSLKLSRNYEKMLGKPLDELLNKTMDELFPSELAKKMIEDDKQILKEGKPVILEEELHSKNYLTYKFPIFINGNPEYLAGYTIDITEKIEAVNKIRESEEKFKAVVNHLDMGMAVHEMIFNNEEKPVDYRFTEVNPGFEKMTGLKRENVLGKTCLEVLPGTEKVWIESYGKIVKTGQSVSFENYSSELKKWYKVFAYKTRDNEFAVVFEDISERKRAEDVLKESAEELRQMNSFMVDRELKMVELKEEINELLKETGREPKY